MRTRRIVLAFLVAIVTAPSLAVSQSSAKPAPPPKKPPSKLKAMAGKLVDTAATAAAGVVVDSLLGTKGASVANALGVAGQPCAQGVGSPHAPASAAMMPGMGGVSAGVAAVTAAKKALKKKDTTATAVMGAKATTTPCPSAQQLAGMVPGGLPGTGPAAQANPAAAAGSQMSAMAAMTPVGMAVAAAPLAGKAAKGLKGMLGGKPQDKIAMLRELGKGHLSVKDVKFIEGTAEMEPGYEASLTELVAAIGMSEGTYVLHVPAESGEKGAPPDTSLARKRLDKVWAVVHAQGVSDQKVIPAVELPPALLEGRKPTKAGDARIELIRFEKQP